MSASDPSYDRNLASALTALEHTARLKPGWNGALTRQEARALLNDRYRLLVALRARPSVSPAAQEDA